MDGGSPSNYIPFRKNQTKYYNQFFTEYNLPLTGNIHNSKITRKTLYGDKQEYGGKIKEKQNYLLYASGTLREKKEIEQIEQPVPQPTIVEEKEIIDNYKYHETKKIKKIYPNKLSLTHHKRLSGPFERTYYTQINEDIPIHKFRKNSRLSTSRNYEYAPNQYNPFESGFKTERLNKNSGKYFSKEINSINDHTPLRDGKLGNKYQATDYRKYYGYNKKLRSASYSSDLGISKYNENRVIGGYGNDYENHLCSCDKKHFSLIQDMNGCSGSKYRVEEEFVCPLHGRQIIKKEFHY